MDPHHEFARGTSLAVVVTLGLLPMVSRFALAGEEHQTLSVTIPVEPPVIKHTARGGEVSVHDFGALLVPGKPKLPSRIFAVAIPPGAVVVDVGFDIAGSVNIPGVHIIAPAPLPRVLGDEDPLLYQRDKRRYEANYAAVYDRDVAYPQAVAEVVRTGGYRQYDLVDIRVTPVTYRPLSGRLTYCPKVTVHVDYRLPDTPLEISVDGFAKTERRARDIIVNYDQIKGEYLRSDSTDSALHDFVIITLDSLVSSVTPLVDWETYKGRSVEVVTTSWIDANYAGYDLAEKMRNFLREKYPAAEWGVEDVLLVGHYDDVPIRRTAPNVAYPRPETDFYYAELSLPDDQSWDADGDHEYGEASDPIDFYAEVNVGRIPWSEPDTVARICEKSVAYEQNDDPAFKKNILLLGAYFWDDTDSAILMETKVDQPWMSEWTITRMYEKNADYWSPYACDYPLLHSNVLAVWSSGTYAFVNYAGHGSPFGSRISGLGGPAFILASDCPMLNDDYPAIVFANACSNSETDHLSIGQSMIKEGAVGFLGSTDVAFGVSGWNDPYDGESSSLDYFFTTRVTSGEYSQGEAHQRALRDMYTYGLWRENRYETFEWGALFGNPDLRIVSPAVLLVAFPDGPPEYLEPGTPTVFSVRIRDGVEGYVPGSGMLHYRYEGGAFVTSPLVHDTGDLYQAFLPPAGAGMTPEFYLSLQGDAGSTISSPADAPATVYTAVVGTYAMLLEEGLDADPGWATEGLWAFGQPSGGGGEYGGPDPTSGHTGSNVYGYNLSGDYENDLGETLLTSGPVDCTGLADVTLKFWRWLGVDQPLYDHACLGVSTNGIDWTTVWENTREIADTAWTLQEVDISSVADDEPTVYLRWTMGSTDGGRQYCGWNIDDIEIWALIPALDPCADRLLGEGEVRIDCGGPCPPCECTSDGPCVDELFCNGSETCDAFGRCQTGPTPCLPQLCREDTDTCDPCVLEEDCADGLFCNGVEICDISGSCLPGTPVDCDDYVVCTIDSCNEDAAHCDHMPDDYVCSDGNVCTTDLCDPAAGCVHDGTGVTDSCNDGDSCTSNDVCQGDAAGTCAGALALAPEAEGPMALPKNRYISFVPGNAGRPTALRVRLTDLPDAFAEYEGETMWVDAPREISESSGDSGATPPPTFVAATLTCGRVYMDWGIVGPLHVYGEAVVPGAMYDIQAIHVTCDSQSEDEYSAALAVSTSIWGDVVGTCSDCPCTPANGVSDFDDIAAVVDKFKNLPCAPTKARADMTPDTPDQIIDFLDIPQAVDAFRSLPYPFGGPSGCP